MYDPYLKYLNTDPNRVNERHNELLKEAEAHRLSNVALGYERAPRRRLLARLLQPLRALLPGVLHLLRVRQWPALSAERPASEP